MKWVCSSRRLKQSWGGKPGAENAELKSSKSSRLLAVLSVHCIFCFVVEVEGVLSVFTQGPCCVLAPICDWSLFQVERPFIHSFKYSLFTENGRVIGNHVDLTRTETRAVRCRETQQHLGALTWRDDLKPVNFFALKSNTEIQRKRNNPGAGKSHGWGYVDLVINGWMWWRSIKVAVHRVMVVTGGWVSLHCVRF